MGKFGRQKGSKLVKLDYGVKCDNCEKYGKHFCVPTQETQLDSTNISATIATESVTPNISEQILPESVTPKAVEQPKPKREATTPWTTEGNPWRRDMLRLKEKRHGFRARWVSERNFERNLDVGWTFADIGNYGGVSDRLVGEEKQIDSRIRRRGLVLMEMPEELAAQRDAYYADRAEKVEKGIKKNYTKDVEQQGAETYGSVS